MKHPRNEILQDYFENALNTYHEGLVKEHLLNCDQCTLILSQMTVIERKIKNDEAFKVSASVKDKILNSAKLKLEMKRTKVMLAETTIQKKEEKREERLKKLEDFVRQSKKSLLVEIKIPVIQACSISLLLLTVIAIEKAQTDEIRVHPINTQVEEMSFNDIDYKVMEEK